MLRSIEITTAVVLTDSPFHNLHWSDNLELSLDCFICQRGGRTTTFVLGAERAVCSGDDHTAEHYTAARIVAFDHTQERQRRSLRAVVDYWWAPFHDAKRDQPATALTTTPWVRHHLGYYCPDQQKSGRFDIQTNEIRPVSNSCEHCALPLVESREAPRIRSLT
ncbi:hypothetical protein ACFOOK_12670 [Micromonospora krabiensis]|uniref:Uncharacterized protein n=1 Tax=Micromonospora krabiensis TaxID=307121 RepID=A0A1C3N281_9ACTN|nr:hypothetical protein [Micromonospora krabiensis]SBV26712.1 hypothetical protein GA0070620_2206 [Micromonospora krabiensis]